MYRWNALAARIASELGERRGARLLVLSCMHNRGFRFVSALDRILRPDLVVNVGDVSGIGGPVESVILRLLYRVRSPQVFTSGNHDSPVTNRRLRAKGAAVLDRPMQVRIAGIDVWGYPDPNHSPLGGPPYNMALVRAAAEATPLPREAGPYVVAVHNGAMVKNIPPEVSLVLCGHAHVPKIWRNGSVVMARCGTTGGGGIGYHGDRQVLVVDLALPEHRPEAIWAVQTDGHAVDVQEMSVQTA